MEAAELARWTRFAAKGGIGKCTAISDCVAENPGDLMFLKDDEITVLMQIVEKPGTYVGYCEGVVGRFQGGDVKFHSKLKKLVKTKRSSLSAASHSQGKSPTPSNGSHPDSPALLPADSRRTRISLDGELAASIRPTIASPVPISSPDITVLPLPRRPPSRDRNSRSRLDDLGAVTPDPKEVSLPVRSPSPVVPDIPPISHVDSPQTVEVKTLEDHSHSLLIDMQTPSLVQVRSDSLVADSHLPMNTKPPVPRAVAPLRTSSLKASTRSLALNSRASLASSRHDSMASSYSQDDDTVHGHDQPDHLEHPPTIEEVPESPPSPKPVDSLPITPPTAVPDTSMSAIFDTSRLSTHSDGETGIGLSLLQNLADTEGFGEWSDSDSDTQLVRRRSSKKNKSGSIRRTKSGKSTRSLARNDSVASRGLVYGSDSGSEDGLRYDDSETGHDTIHEPISAVPPLPTTAEEALQDDLDNMHAQFVTISTMSSRVGSPTVEEMTFPPTAPLSPRSRSRPSPTSFVFPSPPNHTPNASVSLADRERRPSIARSQASTSSFRDGDSVDDESMMDIYDNYRYSRFSVGGQSLAASARRMSEASRRQSASSNAPWMSASSKPVPLPVMDHPDLRPRGDSIQSGTDSKKSMDLPNPFDSALEEPLPERPKFGRSRSNTNASVGPRPAYITPASSAPTSPLPSPPLPPMPTAMVPLADVVHSSPASMKRHVTSGSDSDSSVYTQGSNVHSSRPTSHLPSPTESNTSNTRPTSGVASTAHRPAPLNLANNARQSGDIRSPLLHTTWTPLSSPPPEATATVNNARGYTGTGEGFTGRGKGQDTPESATFFPGVGEGGLKSLSEVISGTSVGEASANETKADIQRVEEMKVERRIVVEEESEDDIKKGTEQLTSRPPVPTSTPGQDSERGATPPLAAVSSAVPPDTPTTTTTIDIQRPPPTLALPGQPMARPPRPSLAELRGAPPGQPEGMRQSLFLPHPNAPKAPSGNSPGPMYISQQQPPPPQPQTRGGAIQTIRLALSTPPLGINARRGPTIYGRIGGDMATATGPIPISFTLEPPGATAPPPGSLPKGRSPPIPPIRVTGSPGPRTPSPLVSQRNDDRPQSVDTKGAIPRPNFYPKSPGARPRSRSFSGFSSPTAEVPMPFGKSREEGSPQGEIPSAADIKESLSKTQPSPPSPSKSSAKPSPLRGSSPLARSSASVGPIAKSPLASSPLSQFTFPRDATKAPSSPTVLSNRPAILRSATSRPNLTESPPQKPVQQIRNVASDIALVKSGETRPSLENDRSSVRSSRSNMSPTPHVLGRQSSLRAKLSLPNLRRTTSRPEEPSSPLSEHRGADGDTVQVQDMDFELIRPNLAHFAAARSSEDSGVLGRETSFDGRLDGKLLRPESPAISTSSPLSSTFPSDAGSSTAFSPKANYIVPDSPRPSDPETSLDAHRQREQKWMTILSSVAASQSRKSKKVKKLLLEGVPSSVRYLVWSHLTDGKSRIVPNVYSQLGARAKVPALGDIERDVNKSFNEYPHLKKSQGPVLSLLQAYLTMVPDIRYSTGLTLISGHLLLMAPEEDAFWIFVSVMDTHLRPYFATPAIQLEVDSTLFSKAVEASDPAVAKKLFIDMAIPPSAICRPWFTRLFVGTLSQQYLDRIWDLFFYEGVSFLQRIGLALFNSLRRKLLECTSPDAALALLLQPVPALLPPSPDALVTLALSVKFKDEDFKKQRVKLEGQLKRQTQAPRPAGSISLPRV